MPKRSRLGRRVDKSQRESQERHHLEMSKRRLRPNVHQEQVAFEELKQSSTIFNIKVVLSFHAKYTPVCILIGLLPRPCADHWLVSGPTQDVCSQHNDITCGCDNLGGAVVVPSAARFRYPGLRMGRDTYPPLPLESVTLTSSQVFNNEDSPAECRVCYLE